MRLLGRELSERTATEPADAAAAVELATWAHMELVGIHPFQEGNGRTARLLMNVVVMRHVTGRTRPLDIQPELKDRYINCVQHARQGRSEPFQDLIADLLEDVVEAEEKRGGFLPLFRRIRWGRR